MKGLFKGLQTTAKVLARGAHTRQYPHVEPELPDRSRGVIALLEENCTSCMLCARECPDWCIYIDSHKEEVPPQTEGGRARQKNVLDRFVIDYSLCMYCGICIEVCPFDALFWAPDFAYAEGDIRNLLHDKEKLGTWMERVPESAWPEGYQGYDVQASVGETTETREPSDVGPESPKPEVSAPEAPRPEEPAADTPRPQAPEAGEE